MKKAMLARNAILLVDSDYAEEKDRYELTKTSELNEIMMEVAADDEQPFPAPYFHIKKKNGKDNKTKK